MISNNNENTSKSVNILLVVLLVISAFIIGSLWTKTEYLQKGISSDKTKTDNQASPTTTVAKEVPAGNTAKPASGNPIVTKTDHTLGNKNATLALIEYSDFECPFCKSFHPTMKQVMETYKDKVVWVYRHFPLSFHANAQKEAEASECAAELGGQNAFWKYVDAIYDRTASNGTGFALDKLAPLAIEQGLDGPKFKDCLDSGRYAKIVQDQMTTGQSEGVTGTPGTVILNTKTSKTQLVPGALPFEQIKEIIDKML